MRFKSIAALTLATGLILGGTSATAGAQQVAPYPSSQIVVPEEFIATVQNFLPGTNADQAEAGIQVVGGSIALNSSVGIAASLLSLLSTGGLIGSSLSSAMLTPSYAY